jgi:S1-C subfamily serine protease
MNASLIELSNAFAEAVESVAHCIVSVNEGGRAGVSGTIWRDGLVVAAEHTIRDKRELTIELPDGKSSTASVVGRDPTTDVALLRLHDDVPAAADFLDAKEIRVGHFVLAVGRRGKDGVVASHGIVSALSGAWRTWRGGRIDHWFRLDLMPFTGFSGGPLINAEGKVIGINTSGPRRSVITVPAATVNRVLDVLLAKGRIARGFLGVALQPVRLPASAAGPGQGLVVVMVDSHGPAEKAGLIVGDVIVAVGEKSVTDTSALQAALDPEQVGNKIQLRVLRGGQPHDVAVVVAERSE